METTQLNNILTIQKIKDQSTGDIHADIEFAKTFFPKYPQKNPKPQMQQVRTSADAKEYATILEEWEKKDLQYKNEMDIYRKQFQITETIITEYMKEMSGFSKVPNKSKERVWSKAWDDGKSSGYGSVYSHLEELVELFN